jgi:hypothetical protein
LAVLILQRWVAWVAVGAVGILSGRAVAESLEEKVQWRDDLAKMDSARAKVKDKCGADVAFDFDKASFSSWDWTKRKPHQACERAFNELGYICGGSPEGKRAVQDKVKSVLCTVRGNSEPEAQSVKGGTLRYTIAATGNNSQDGQLLRRALDPGLPVAERWATIDKNLQQKTKQMNGICETQLAIEVDRASFAKRMDDRYNANLCDAPVSALQQRCQDAAARKGAAKLKRIVCRASERPITGFEAVKDGALIFEVGKGGGSNADGNLKWLGEHL